MQPQELKELESRLISLRDELRDIIARNEEELGQQLGSSKRGEERLDFNHPADMVGSDPDYEKELNLLDRERQELSEVNRALERMADGSYGFCEECGTGISLERLRIIPYTRHCLSCQEILDREHQKRGQIATGHRT